MKYKVSIIRIDYFFFKTKLILFSIDKTSVEIFVKFLTFLKLRNYIGAVTFELSLKRVNKFKQYS